MAQSPADRIMDLARTAALKFNEGRDYLPKTVAQAAEFFPHCWVIEAMEAARRDVQASPPPHELVELCQSIVKLHAKQGTVLKVEIERMATLLKELK